MHASAVELVESMADRLRRLEPERTLLDDYARLGQLLQQLAVLGTEDRT